MAVAKLFSLFSGRAFARLGLRARMAASYVLVSAAAVLLVELILLTLVAPQMRAASENAAQTESELAAYKAKGGADDDAANLSVLAANLAARRRGQSDAELLAAVAREFDRESSVIRSGSGSDPDGPLEALAAPDGRIVASSAPGVLKVGSSLPPAARRPSATAAGASEVWATAAVRAGQVIGLVYLRVPAKLGRTDSEPVGAPSEGKPFETGPSWAKKPAADAGPVEGMLVPGLIVLALLLPVGVLFGLLSTRGLIRRVRRLADSTQAVAAGDLSTRIPVSGGDEVARLEAGFNWMAERLDAAVRTERETADARARTAERTRIARELHDSVSQDLFSISLLAAGMRRALPDGSPLRHQAESMERTADRTMREMRAMLLELRPVALEDAGLVAALEELCRAYEARLGIRIAAEIGALRLEPAAELAVLRVAQEALSNAARHGRAQHIELSVAEADGHVVMAIRDGGRGFDPAGVGERHGMGLDLMRERVAELGGTFDIASAPRRGTTVRVRIPGGAR